MQAEESILPITIGYYPFRGQAQVLRLVCNYVHLPYYDCFFDPSQWRTFKESQARNHPYKDLPFLKHEDIVLTKSNAMLNYAIELSGRNELLGCTLEEQYRIDAFRSKDCLGIILGFLCSTRKSSNVGKTDKRKQLNQLYQKTIAKLMHLYEQQCNPHHFYINSLTVIDFIVYEIINYFRLLFPQQMHKFTKLSALRDKVAALPQILEYEMSQRGVTQYCPIRYFKKFREKMEKQCQSRRSGDSTQSGSSENRVSKKKLMN